MCSILGVKSKVTEWVKGTFPLLWVCVDVCLALVCLQGANVLLNDQGQVKLGRWALTLNDFMTLSAAVTSAGCFCASAAVWQLTLNCAFSMTTEHIFRNVNAFYLKAEKMRNKSRTGRFGDGTSLFPVCSWFWNLGSDHGHAGSADVLHRNPVLVKSTLSWFSYQPFLYCVLFIKKIAAGSAEWFQIKSS